MQNPDDPSNLNKTEHQPIFLLPQAVMILAILLIAIHFAYELSLDDSGKLEVWIWLGFIPARLFDVSAPGGMWPLIWTPVTHAFLHGDWTHLAMNIAWLAIFGTPVARRFGGGRFLAIFIIGAIGGAALYLAFNLESLGVLIGASGGVAGLTGAAMRFVFEPVQMARHPETGVVVALGRKLTSIMGIWANPRARAFTLFWLGINLFIPIYGLFTDSDGPLIAWQAHIGGFVVGLILPGVIERNMLKAHQ